jgi:membrane-associated phospholipid phosphatase
MSLPGDGNSGPPGVNSGSPWTTSTTSPAPAVSTAWTTGSSRSSERAARTLAVVDRPRRGAWLRGTALTAGAHVAGSAVKRVVRRPRPAHVEPLVGTVGRHSFPSAHATSAAAAAVAFGALGARAVPPLAVAVCVSRLVAGVHYPSDVAAGAALGALTARLGARWMTGGPA